MRLMFLFFFVFVFVAGCAYKSSIPDQTRYDLEKPIDCSTAQQDIQILESEKASSTQQALAGVKMVVPASAARGILHRDYLNRGEVATGEYNRDIDAKIKEIKTNCGIE